MNQLWLSHTPHIVHILHVLVVILLLSTHNHRLSIMLTRLDISLELLLGSMSIYGFEVLGDLGRHVLWGVLDVYLSFLFMDRGGDCRLQGLDGLPLVSLQSDVFVAHGSKIIYI